MASSPMTRSRPSFFKVFFPHLCSQHLKIPPAFRKHLGGKFPGMVSLRGPGGSVWLVELVESSEGLQLENGWKDFVADHSIAFGDFLVFLYDGGLHFSVMVFDSTACEKEVAYVARPCRPDILVIDESKKEEEREITGDSAPDALVLSPRGSPRGPRKRKMQKLDFPNIQGLPLKKKHTPSEAVAAKPSQHSVPNLKSKCPKSNIVGSKACIIPDSGALDILHSSNATGHEMCEDSAPSSLNKVHKVIPGKKSRKCGWLSVQQALHKKSIFSSQYSAIVNKANSKLQTGHVAKPSPYAGTSTSQYLNLDNACKTSVSKQSTKDSQCSRLIKYNQRSGKVVCKVQKMPTLISQRRPVTTAEVVETLRTAKSFKSEYPFIPLVLQESYVYYGFYLNIPSSFARDYLPKVAKKMTLWDPNGRRWPVSFVPYKNRSALSAGWGRFSFANNLEKYDVCVFELFKKNHMKVHIFRVVDEIKPLLRKSKHKYEHSI